MAASSQLRMAEHILSCRPVLNNISAELHLPLRQQIFLDCTKGIAGRSKYRVLDRH